MIVINHYAHETGGGPGPPQPDGGDVERLWAGLAITPMGNNSFNTATQELLERAWMEISDGLY